MAGVLALDGDVVDRGGARDEVLRGADSHAATHEVHGVEV